LALFRFPIANTVFRDDRLVSSRYAVLFGVSAAMTIGLIFFMGHSRSPWAARLSDPSHFPPGLKLLWLLLFTATLASVFFLWLGMWFYWARMDYSGKVVKTISFFVLLFGAFYASIAYYLSFYLWQTIRARKETARRPA
jgi:hypothetical protein